MLLTSLETLWRHFQDSSLRSSPEGLQPMMRRRRGVPCWMATPIPELESESVVEKEEGMNSCGRRRERYTRWMVWGAPCRQICTLSHSHQCSISIPNMFTTMLSSCVVLPEDILRIVFEIIAIEDRTKAFELVTVAGRVQRW